MHKSFSLITDLEPLFQPNLNRLTHRPGRLDQRIQLNR